jgi:malonate-semialdehyde dehydrogenase (acetylating)/methylmalonate-semialdehyde dehydrogenase
MPDANLDLTVKEIVSAAFGSAGERCMSASVVVAVGEVAEPFMEKLVHAANNIKDGKRNGRRSIPWTRYPGSP